MKPRLLPFHQWVLRALRQKFLVLLAVFLGVVSLLEVGISYQGRISELATDSHYLAEAQVKNLQTYDYARIKEALGSFAVGRHFENVEGRIFMATMVGNGTGEYHSRDRITNVPKLSTRQPSKFFDGVRRPTPIWDDCFITHSPPQREFLWFEQSWREPRYLP